MTEMTVFDDLRAIGGCIYVATPYTDYPLGRGAAAYYTERVAEALEFECIKHFAPVAWGHEISERAGIDPCDIMFWANFCQPFIRLCSGLLVVTFQGWQASSGVTREMALFEAMGRPTVLADPQSLLGYQIERSVPVGQGQELILG